MKNNKFKPLESTRLVLRKFTYNDVDTFWKYRANEDVAKFQGWSSYTKERAVDFVNEQIKAESNIPGKWLQVAIELKDTGVMIGDCAIHTLLDDSTQVEIGFTLDPKYQERGYMTEVVTTLLDYLFYDLKKHRVSAITDVRNISSIKLLERIGMRREGHFIENIWFKGAWGDEYLYAILDKEWFKR